MQKYVVAPEEFYKAFPVEGLPYAAKVAECISQLVDACELRGKKILSVGAGTAHEEYFFIKHGCDVTIVDIDEHKAIENALKNMQQSENTRFTYYIGDATTETIDEEKFDAIYFSSFTPDEVRRANIQKSIRFMLACKIFNKLGFFSLSRLFNRIEWDKMSPFHLLIELYAKKYLLTEGCLIIQSYYGGVDPYVHKGYVDSVRSFFKGLHLPQCSVYAFSSVPGVMLYIASTRRMKDHAISAFHGRSDVERKIIELTHC